MPHVLCGLPLGFGDDVGVIARCAVYCVVPWYLVLSSPGIFCVCVSPYWSRYRVFVVQTELRWGRHFSPSTVGNASRCLEFAIHMVGILVQRALALCVS